MHFPIMSVCISIFVLYYSYFLPKFLIWFASNNWQKKDIREFKHKYFNSDVVMGNFPPKIVNNPGLIVWLSLLCNSFVRFEGEKKKNNKQYSDFQVAKLWGYVFNGIRWLGLPYYLAIDKWVDIYIQLTKFIEKQVCSDL